LFAEKPMTSVFHTALPTFEETFPKAPFAELVRLSLVLADGLVKLRARLTSGPAAAGSGQPAVL
jgi:hypothetical protein